jgi:hypothetical protein
MKITNTRGLPQILMNLFAKQEYSKGLAHISVTEMIGAPRVSILRSEHNEEMEEDISDRFWAIMGTNIHYILQQGADDDHLAEERLYTQFEGWTLSGAIDVQKVSGNGVTVIDWKFVSTYAVKDGVKPEWEKQLNCYAYLIRKEKGKEVKDLQVCAILRDWSKAKAETDKSYPQAPIHMIDIPMWEHEVVEKFVQERIRMHRDARRAHDWGEGLPECTDEDRWLRPSSWVAMKPGGKRATKVFETKEAAEAYIAAEDAKLDLIERPGDAVRCIGDYCGVSKWCDQYKKAKG